MPRHRRRMRIESFRYGGNFWYFVTMCTAGRTPVLATIDCGHLTLSGLGTLVERCWKALPAHHPGVFIDTHVVMPDHVHAVLTIADGFPTTLPTVMGSWKSAVTREARRSGRWGNAALWQRGYHEQIIRRPGALAAIRRYIMANPAQWDLP